MIKTHVLLVTVIFLVACTPTAFVIPATTTITQLSLPIAPPTSIQTQTSFLTATPIPFSAMHLDNLLFQQNDLPTVYTGGVLSNQEGTDTTPVISSLADYFITQDINLEGHKAVVVTVWVYQTKVNTLLRYQEGLSWLEQDCHKSTLVCYTPEPYSVTNLGEEAMMQNNFYYAYHDLFFYRCYAVIHIIMLDYVEEATNVITTYAKNLDKRLIPFVCR